jgi:hypothetical protein
VGVTRTGRFSSVARLGDAGNPEFLGKTGNYSLAGPGRCGKNSTTRKLNFRSHDFIEHPTTYPRAPGSQMLASVFR